MLYWPAALLVSGIVLSVTVEDLPVGQMNPQRVHVEPHVAVGSLPPSGLADHWVVGAITTDPQQREDWRCSAIATLDGGTTWHRTDFEINRCIDPWVSVDADGSVTLVAVEIQSGREGDDRYALVGFRSIDGGITWSNRHEMGRTFEHPMIYRRGTANYLLSRVTDLTSGHRQVSLYAITGDLGLQPVVRFEPFGSGFDMPVGMAVLESESVGIAALAQQPFRVGYNHLTGDGEIGEMIQITGACGEGSGTFGGYPGLAHHQEHLFFACAGPNYAGYWLVVSRDRGTTWEAARRVDQDDGQVRTPMIATSANGTLAMAWYDRRNDPDRACQDVYFAWSADLGRSLSEPVRVSSETSCPNSPGNGRAGTSWNSGGDYGSLTALGPETFLLIWADSRSGRFQLRYAILDVSQD